MNSCDVYEAARALEGVSKEQARELAAFLANEKPVASGTITTFTAGIVTHASRRRHFASSPDGARITCEECVS